MNGAYVNVPNAGMADWETAYWGPNVDRLRTIKAKYDPGMCSASSRACLRHRLIWWSRRTRLEQQPHSHRRCQQQRRADPRRDGQPVGEGVLGSGQQAVCRCRRAGLLAATVAAASESRACDATASGVPGGIASPRYTAVMMEPSIAMPSAVPSS